MSLTELPVNVAMPLLMSSGSGHCAAEQDNVNCTFKDETLIEMLHKYKELGSEFVC